MICIFCSLLRRIGMRIPSRRQLNLLSREPTNKVSSAEAETEELRTNCNSEKEGNLLSNSDDDESVEPKEKRRRVSLSSTKTQSRSPAKSGNVPSSCVILFLHASRHKSMLPLCVYSRFVYYTSHHPKQSMSTLFSAVSSPPVMKLRRKEIKFTNFTFEFCDGV